MSAQTFIDRLQRVKNSGSDRGLASCPGPLHERGDQNRSLSWKLEGERVLFHCFAGCEPSEVLSAMGLTFRDVMPERGPDHEPNRSWFPAADILEAVDHEMLTATLILWDAIRRRRIKPSELIRLNQAAQRIGAARDRVRPAKIANQARAGPASVSRMTAARRGIEMQPERRVADTATRDSA